MTGWTPEHVMTLTAIVLGGIGFIIYVWRG